MTLYSCFVKQLALHPEALWCRQSVASRVWTAKDFDVDTLKYKNSKAPSTFKGLKVLPRAPNVPPKDRMRKSYLTRGPCLREDAELQLKQYGVIALKGGLLKFGHLNSTAFTVNRFIKNKEMHAIWRVEAPYHAITKHPLQAVMGGGKGKIDHYVTPVKARQVIFEVGGRIEFSRVYPVLKSIAVRLPFPAMAVEYEMLKDMYEEERRLEEENENFFTFRELVTKNMQGIGAYVTKADLKQFGKLK